MQDRIPCATHSTNGDLRTIFLNTNGIPSKAPLGDGLRYFWFDPQGVWRVDQGDLSFDIEKICITLHDDFASAIFGGIDTYWAILPYVPEWIFTAGLDSESKISCEQLVQLVSKGPSDQLHQLMYLYDCRKLVSGVQEVVKEVAQLCGEFYRALNLDDLFYPPSINPDGLRFITSPTTTKIIAFLNYIFVRLHSLLDYTTKLLYEIEHIKSDFSSYPKLASGKVLFSDSRKLTVNGRPGTLFESCALLTEIETVRNLVIHDGFLDDMPKVYQHTEQGQILQKFVLMPDLVGGRLTNYKNRKLFYRNDDLINLRLPKIISEFQSRLLTSLQLAAEQLNEVIKGHTD